jgi:serine/threonine protein kinase
MLTDALLHCHRMQVCHRDLRPSTVLVTRPARYQRDLLLGQFNLKLTDFRLSSLQPLYYESSGQEPEAERFSAPEVTPVSRNSGMGFEASSDVWSLGMVMYYLACGGACMIEDPRDLLLMSPERTSSLGPGQASGQTEDESQQLMHTLSQRHGLQERSPVLYDFVDRTARPLGRRISSALLRCHPLLWPLTRKREFLLSFSQTGLDESTMHGVSGQPPAHLEPFLVAFDKYAPQYVFGAQGWVQSMSPALLNLVRPISVRNEHWWSGRGLLQALRSHLLQPDALAAVYTGLSPAQVLAAYIRELTEVCFPRLLNLVFELGGTYGAWSWDGDEVGHRWR